jgi:transcriptional regulator with XRE-family HTH domain
MQNLFTKSYRAELFRERLQQAMKESGSNQSHLSREAGVDRSTISQLIKSDGPRLPNAHLIAQCASVLGVSADWLLGITDKKESAADLLAASMSMTEASRALIDEQIFQWHQEAAGYKIRHVPAGLPDMLKTSAMLEWEYAPALGRSTTQAIKDSESRLELMRRSRSDYEIAVPLHDLRAFAHAEGYYSGLPLQTRLEQIDRMREITTEHYPSLRLCLFDARRLYSAPVTIFGPLLAVIYLGQNYLAFRDLKRVDAITAHFDTLVREAEVPSRDLPKCLESLRAEIL